MTDEEQPENNTAGGLFKENPRVETNGVDPMDFTAEDGSPLGFDEYLRSFDHAQVEFDDDSDPNDEFGTLKESAIAIGRSGLQPPELDGKELEHDEITFGIVEGELRAIVKALALLLKHRPAAHRRCRLTIKPMASLGMPMRATDSSNTLRPGARRISVTPTSEPSS